MARDMWVYQARNVREPWAVHVWLHDDATIDVAVYAEWLPDGTTLHKGIPATFDQFVGRIGQICGELTLEDMKQLNQSWAKFAIANDLI